MKEFLETRNRYRHRIVADDIVFILAELGDEVIGLGEDILYQDPIFRLRSETKQSYIDQMYVPSTAEVG